MGLISQVIALGATALILYVAITKLIDKRSYERKKQQHGCGEAVKYPHSEPFIGIDLLVKDAKEHTACIYLEEIQHQYAIYGKTHEVVFLGKRMIRTMEPKNIQAVLGLNAKDYGLQPLREGLAEPLFGHGINTTDGEYWQYSRSLIKPTFSRVEICNLASLEFHFKRLLELLPKDGATVDLQPLFSRLFLDTSTEFLFGKSADTLLPLPAEEGELFIKSFDYVMEGLGNRVRLGRLKFLYRDPLWFESVRIVHAFVEKHIDVALEGEKQRKMNGGTEDEKDHRYILLNEMVKQTQDKLDLRSQILAVFMPSRDTTAFLVANIFHALARNSTIWTRLRKEVMAVGSQPLTFELLKSIKYLQWVINEAHRMYSISDNNPRCVLADSILPTGGGPDEKSPLLVRKGEYINFNIYCLHQDEDIWGPDVAVFRPERWEGLKPFWSFIPFGGGPRTCPAQQLVNTEAAYVTVRMMQEFAKVESRDEYPWTEQWRIGPHSKYGCKVSLTPA
ncbi:cytochrome P450 alkane hydroxylase-like protein [Mollisia scopiformis]|uniref:Cytochrome P450 alkane hydroxylase-like protein n=1 Tax=Mollisia scopiformis TaxID=149040 RepID=A0A194XG31_MOLSC|nr:cytochrome P450 alkane hydroxylase-like protein [Mollisia scopiformis]KUJ19155.1 cytochrome P450 alkane hydroxylase-like protein [Mollisia scopiformis]